MIRVERTETGRVLVEPSPGMVSRAKAREEEGRCDGKRHWYSEQYMNGFLAEACYHVALDRAGVEHRWHDDWSQVDITLHTGRRVDVKCRHTEGGWDESYGVSIPAYIVERETCDVVALAAWDGSVMTLLGLLALTGVRHRGTHLMAQERFSSGKPVRHECYEVTGRQIPKLATQLPVLRRGSYARESDQKWWMELWPQTA